METMKPHLARMFAHGAWANREVHETLSGAEARGIDISSGRKMFAHIVATERLWFVRLLLSGEKVTVWPDWALARSSGEAAAIAERWVEYLSTLKDADSLSRSIPYVNTQGAAFSSTVLEILIHVALHSSYHRGQIAILLRTAGHPPPYTDFIHFTRSVCAG
jgi:uncharacterized damage-inducible protein DinB